MDTDKSGSINFLELMSVITAPDRLPLLFQILDLDHNGPVKM